MERVYDMVIIGGGPAGYTAALYAARAGLDTVIIEKMAIGGQMATTDIIDNYPGFPEGIEGIELGMRMKSQAERFGARTEYGEITGVELSGEVKVVSTDFGHYLGRTVVIATGAAPRKLGIPDEEHYTGMGVHYCAHCDGRFYKGKTVVVVGGGNSAVSDALYLSNLAERVILVHRRDTLRATKIYHKALENAKNVEFLRNSQILGLGTDDRVRGVIVLNNKNQEQKEIECDAVFVSIGREPETAVFGDALDLDDAGYIVADESTRTNICGVFAVGDVRRKALRQVVTAVSDGAVAVHFAEEYLAERFG